MSEINLGKTLKIKSLIKEIKSNLKFIREDSISKSNTNHKLHELINACDCKGMYDPTAYYSIWNYLVADINELIKRFESEIKGNKELNGHDE